MFFNANDFFKGFNDAFSSTTFPGFFDYNLEVKNKSQEPSNSSSYHFEYNGMNNKEFVDYIVSIHNDNKLTGFKMVSDNKNDTLTISYDVNENNSNNDELIVKFIDDEEFCNKFKNLLELREKKRAELKQTQETQQSKPNINRNKVTVSFTDHCTKSFDIDVITDLDTDKKYFNLSDIDTMLRAIDPNLTENIKTASKSMNDVGKMFENDNGKLVCYVTVGFLCHLLSLNEKASLYYDLYFEIWKNLINTEDLSDMRIGKIFMKFDSFLDRVFAE